MPRSYYVTDLVDVGVCVAAVGFAIVREQRGGAGIVDFVYKVGGEGDVGFRYGGRG